MPLTGVRASAGAGRHDPVTTEPDHAWLAWVESPHGQVAAVILLTAAAALLRFYRLGDWSFWIDELHSINRALAHSQPHEVLARWPPLSVLFMGATLHQMGVSEWTARLVPAIIGVVSIPILYVPARRLLGARTALLAALLLTVSPWHVFWSQNARFYTPLMLLYALAAFAIFSALERDRRWLIVLATGLFLLAFRERYLALMLVPVVLTYLLLVRMRWFGRPPGLRAGMMMPLVLIVGALVVYDLSKLFFGRETLLFSGVDLAHPEPAGTPIRLLTTIGFDAGIPLIVLALAGGGYLLLARSRQGLFLLLGAVVPIGVLIIVNPFLFTDARYAFITLPSWILLSATAAARLLDSVRRREVLLAAAVIAMVVADASATNLLYFRAYHGNRLDWKGAFSIARERSRPDDAFVAWWPEFGPHYVPGAQVIAWTGLQPSDVDGTGRRYWFVLDSERVWTNMRMKEWVEAHGELIDVRYLRTPRDAWLRVYLYDPDRSSTGR